MSLLRRTAGLVWLCLLLAAAVQAQTVTVRHTLQPGETLYQLSRKYGVSVMQILGCNPTVVPDSVRAGDVVLIPSSGVADGGCREMHRIQKGETVWGIARKYGLTVDELLAANPQVESSDYKLKKGKMLCIPYPAAQAGAENGGAADAGATAAARPLDKINVAMLLPFTSEKGEGERSIEYYRGFLMAVDKIRQEGTSVSVFAFDEPSDDSQLTAVFEKMRQYGVHLIVGPVYPGHFGSVAAFAAGEGVKVCVPFSSKLQDVATNPQLFLLNAPEQSKAAFAGELVQRTFPDVDLVVVRTGRSNEAVFASALAGLVLSRGGRQMYVNEGFSAAELEGVLLEGRRTILLPDASDKAAFSRIFPAVAAYREAHPAAQVSLMGYPDWLTYAGGSVAELHKADTYVCTHSYYNSRQAATVSFEASYRQWFKTGMLDVLPRMGLLGYDSGLSLLKGLSVYGMDFAAQAVDVPALQSQVRFRRYAGEGGYVNDCTMLIHFQPGGGVEKIKMP